MYQEEHSASLKRWQIRQRHDRMHAISNRGPWINTATKAKEASARTRRTGPTKRPKMNMRRWKKVHPKQGEPEKKEVRDMEWLWYSKHMTWTLHYKQDCRVKKAREEYGKQDKPVVARDATVAMPMATQINPKFATFMVTLAKIANQEEWLYFLAWAFVILMTKDWNTNP